MCTYHVCVYSRIILLHRNSNPALLTYDNWHPGINLTRCDICHSTEFEGGVVLRDVAVGFLGPYGSYGYTKVQDYTETMMVLGQIRDYGF
jgi:hypothetical protein